MSLNNYLQDVQRLLREQRQEWLNPSDLIAFVNRARREIAFRSQCLRIITPISGSITAWVVDQQGSNYTNSPVLTVSSPDFPSGSLPNPTGAQATASAIVVGGHIQSIGSTFGGAGYFQPTLVITDATGSGAVANPILTFVNELNQGQEVYPFSGVDLSANPGVGAVYAVISISCIYANYRYSLPVYSFSVYQAMVRQYPFQYQYVPSFASQYGQGTNGSFYVYPLPSQTYQYELDCLCVPLDLTADTSFEALPLPWTDSIAFLACQYGMMELQNYNAANYYKSLFDEFAQRHSIAARPGRAINPYGRY